jgi:phospholipid/cholesterol/gamma-HCH transport system substrate-binding protein
VSGSSSAGRIAAIVALGAAVLVVAVLLLGGGGGYSVTAQFENASQLVKGNQVQVAGLPAGSIDDISLGPDGTALVKMSIDDDYAPLHEGTTATVRSEQLVAPGGPVEGQC